MSGLPSFTIGDGELLEEAQRADGVRVTLHRLGPRHFVVKCGKKRRSFPTLVAARVSFAAFCRKEAT